MEVLEIKEFSANPSESSGSGSQTFGSLFGNAQTNIYGCAVGEGSDFYELVLKTETTGFATWYSSSNQKTFKLEKSNDKWEIKAGVYTGIPTQSFKFHNPNTKQN